MEADEGQKAVLIAAARVGYSIREACELAGVPRSRRDEWKRADSKFNLALRRASNEYAVELQEAWDIRRAAQRARYEEMLKHDAPPLRSLASSEQAIRERRAAKQAENRTREIRSRLALDSLDDAQDFWLTIGGRNAEPWEPSLVDATAYLIASGDEIIRNECRRYSVANPETEISVYEAGEAGEPKLRIQIGGEICRVWREGPSPLLLESVIAEPKVRIHVRSAGG